MGFRLAPNETAPGPGSLGAVAAEPGKPDCSELAPDRPILL